VTLVLVAPMLVGFQWRYGQALAPLQGALGGDIRASMGTLDTNLSIAEITRDIVAGGWEIYGNTVFGEYGLMLGAAAGRVVQALGLACFLAGALALTLRGPRYPVILSVAGVCVPPFLYLAGVNARGGPGGGYTQRYTYLILPAVLAVASWMATRAAQRVWQAVACETSQRAGDSPQPSAAPAWGGEPASAGLVGVAGAFMPRCWNAHFTFR